MKQKYNEKRIKGTGKKKRNQKKEKQKKTTKIHNTQSTLAAASKRAKHHGTRPLSHHQRLHPTKVRAGLPACDEQLRCEPFS